MPKNLTITIPSQGLKQEREYSIRMLVNEFLGLDYELIYHEQPEYIFQAGDTGQVSIKDNFFARFNKPEDYLKPENIPQKIQFLDVEEWNIKQLPVLFGNNSIYVNENIIECGSDLFASTFFMLSRWEEYANIARDEHSRFPGNESLAYKQGFLNRPLVNEYADLLWQMLKMIAYKGERKKRTYNIIPTHDIDDLLFWTEQNEKKKYHNLAGDLLKRDSLKMAQKRWSSFLETKNNQKKDPYYTYDHLMDQAEQIGVRAQFYFMAGGETAYDRTYDLNSALFNKITANIKARSHLIGYHASYNTYNKQELFFKEKEALQQALDMEITIGRQHYLRYENPVTWQIWDEAAMAIDSTHYYSDYPGFSCGSCYRFPLFDILNRKQLQLTEQPLLIMDGCLENMDTEKAVSTLNEIKQQTKKHKGDFVFLIHNSSYGWMNTYPSFNAIENNLYET